MSRISEVIKNKNRIERLRRDRRKEELNNLKQNTSFKARLYDELRKIDVLLDMEGVDGLIIEVPMNNLAKFGASIYSEDLAEYDIQQVEGTANKFIIRRKMIQF